MSSNEEVLRKEKTFIQKMDLVLVQVLKHEWPHNWPSFISDIVNSSKVSQDNMIVFKSMSEA